MRPAAVALIAVVAVAAAGCLGDEERRTVPSGNVTADLERARAVQPPLYYAGPRVAGLDLTAVSMTSQPRATISYGTCELPAGEGGCSPPIQIQHIPFSSAAWRRAEGCRALEPIRDVPAARHDGLVLFTGGRVLKVYARSTAEERRIALALRPVAGGSAGAPLPHPTAAVRALVARVCR